MSDGVEKTAWTFEHTVFVKRRYVTHFFDQDEPNAINRLRARIATIQQVLGQSRSQTMLEILLAGLEKLEEEIAAGNKGKVPERGTSEYRSWVICQKQREIYEQKAMLAELEPVYKELGPQAFIDWCESEGIEYEEFLKSYSWRSEQLRQCTRDRDWLREYLESRGGEASTSDIHGAAVSGGIVHDDRDWRRLEKNAERMDGVRKHYGTWRLESI